MKTSPFDRKAALRELLHELGSHFGPGAAWLFITKDRQGMLAVFTNVKPAQARILASEYTKRAPT